MRAPQSPSAIRCRVLGRACLRGTAETIAQMRKKPIALGTRVQPATFLKHADDQAVLGLNAVLEVIKNQSWEEHSFASWGVLAAPNFIGRASIAQAIERFRIEGAWGVSPHLIPHQSLHALSGTISQALALHGPNFGVGGGPNSGPDAFLLAAALLGDVPGLWLVLTGHESEWIPAPNRAAPAPPCLAVALALTADVEAGAAALSIEPTSEAARSPEFRLEPFAHALQERSGRWRLAATHDLEYVAEMRG